MKCSSDNLFEILESKGAVVQGLGDRKGVRYIAKGGHGGSRPAVATLKETSWLHEDAQECTLCI